MSRTRLAWSFSLLLAFFLCPYAPAQPAENEGYSHVRIIRLSLVQGQVSLTRMGETEARKAVMNDPVGHGARLSTAEGIAEIELESNAVIRLAENSRVAMTELGLRGDGGRVTQVALEKGTATFQVKLGKADDFQVTTPQLQVSVPKKAQFRVDVYNNESTVIVRKGEVALDAHSSTTTLAKGKSAVIRAEETGAIQVAKAPQRDDWDHWNERREETMEVASSRRYLPASLGFGAADLGRWGLWFNYPGYGYVWQPFATASWTPFFDGFWDWMPGLGYTWVSFEPWGWLPYHYGRWLLTPYGWAWVPGYFNWFSPGTVYWINCGNYVGWAPKQPGKQPAPTTPSGGTLPPGTVVNTPDGVTKGGPNRHIMDVKGIDLGRATLMDRPEQIPELRELARQPAARPKGPQAVGSQTTPSASPFLFEPRERRFVLNPKAREAELTQGREAARERIPTEAGRVPGGLMPPGLLKATEERRSGVKMAPSQEVMPRMRGDRDSDRGEMPGRSGGGRSPDSARPSGAPRPPAEARPSPPPSRPPAPSGAHRPSAPTKPHD